MKDSHWPVFTNVKTNSRRVKFLSFRSFGNLLTSFCIGIAVSGLMQGNSARILSLKRPSAGTRNGSAAIPSAFAPKTTLTQRHPADLEQQTVKFHWFVITSHHRHGYSLSRIFNMGETPMWFKLPSSRTLEFSGNRTVPVKSCGTEKWSFTVTLAVAADGKKLPPSVTFKGVRTPRDLVVPPSVKVSFHKKGWMDEAGKLRSLRISRTNYRSIFTNCERVRFSTNCQSIFTNEIQYFFLCGLLVLFFISSRC